MDLRELLDEIGGAIDHDPVAIPASRDMRVRFINRCYLDADGQEMWTFAERTAQVTIYGDFVPSGAQRGTFTTGVYAVLTTAITAAAVWAGQVLAAPDGVDYTIAAVDTSTNTLYLAVPYAGTTVTSVAWRIRHDFVYLPSDCDDSLGWTDRSGAQVRLVTIGRRTEEMLTLDFSETGDPRVVVEWDWEQDRSPAYAPTLAQSDTAGGALTLLHTFEYCYTFLNRGVEGPPSPTVEIELTGTNDTVTVSGMEDTRVNTVNTFIQKYVYRRDKTQNGLWVRVGSALAAGTTSYVDDGTANLGPQLDVGTEPARRVRIYRKPAAGQTATVFCRYRRRPRRMYADGDVPYWPERTHAYLVHATSAAILRSRGNLDMAAAEEQKAAIVYQRMKKRYLSTADERHVRGMWGTWSGRRINPSTTFSSDFGG